MNQPQNGPHILVIFLELKFIFEICYMSNVQGQDPSDLFPVFSAGLCSILKLFSTLFGISLISHLVIEMKSL